MCWPKPLAPTLIAVLIALPVSGVAQTVTGRVVDDATAAGVEAVQVIAVNSAGIETESVLTDRSGAFVLNVEDVGRYRLRTQRIGYQTVTSPDVDLLRGDTMQVELRIAVEAVVLEPLTVTSDRPALVLDPRLERRGFYQRQDLYGTKMGFASFMDAEAILERIPFRTTDLFRQVRGLKVVSLGGRRVDIRSVRDETCRPDYYVNGIRLRLGPRETIDHYVMPASIAAIEIYSGTVYPAEYAPTRCGSIVVWTGYAEGKYADPGG